MHGYVSKQKEKDSGRNNNKLRVLFYNAFSAKRLHFCLISNKIFSKILNIMMTNFVFYNLENNLGR